MTRGGGSLNGSTNARAVRAVVVHAVGGERSVQLGLRAVPVWVGAWEAGVPGCQLAIIGTAILIELRQDTASACMVGTR